MKGYLGSYRNTRYHLPEFQGGRPPIGREEIFNQTHSSLRSCIERTFGVGKRRWKILQVMTIFSFHIQRDIVIASMTLHNYIRIKSNDYIFHKFDQYPNVVPPNVFPDSQERSQPHPFVGGTIREMDKLRYQIASSLMSQRNGS